MSHYNREIFRTHILRVKVEEIGRLMARRDSDLFLGESYQRYSREVLGLFRAVQWLTEGVELESIAAKMGGDSASVLQALEKKRSFSLFEYAMWKMKENGAYSDPRLAEKLDTLGIKKSYTNLGNRLDSFVDSMPYVEKLAEELKRSHHRQRDYQRAGGAAGIYTQRIAITGGWPYRRDPTGYDSDPETHILHKNANNEKLRRAAFLIINGEKSPRSALQSVGLPDSHPYRTLSSPVYIGKIPWKDKNSRVHLYPGKHESTFTAKEWDQLQNALKRFKSRNLTGRPDWAKQADGSLKPGVKELAIEVLRRYTGNPPQSLEKIALDKESLARFLPDKIVNYGRIRRIKEDRDFRECNPTLWEKAHDQDLPAAPRLRQEQGQITQKRVLEKLPDLDAEPLPASAVAKKIHRTKTQAIRILKLLRHLGLAVRSRREVRGRNYRGGWWRTKKGTELLIALAKAQDPPDTNRTLNLPTPHTKIEQSYEWTL